MRLGHAACLVELVRAGCLAPAAVDALREELLPSSCPSGGRHAGHRRGHRSPARVDDAGTDTSASASTSITEEDAAHIACLPAAEVLPLRAQVLGSWGNTMRDAVENEER